MDTSVLRTVVLDQREIIRNTTVVPRDYTLEAAGNYVITGLRRAGKSTLLYGVAQELVKNGANWDQILYINFEDERLAEFQLSDFNDILVLASAMTSKPTTFFFDEIQNIDGWQRFARRLADSGQHVLITGSNARMLSQDIASTLGGRYLTLQVDTFSFEEYVRAARVDVTADALATTTSHGLMLRELEQFFTFGGFPESLRFQDKRGYVESIYQKVLLGDVVARNGLRSADQLRILVKKIAEAANQRVSFSKLFNTVRTIGLTLSKDTLIRHISEVEDAFLLFHLSNASATFVEKESTPKYYFSDNGLLNLFLINRDSALLENLVAITLRRRYPQEIAYFWDANRKIDIDFYLPKSVIAIQVAYSLANSDTRKREISSLENLAKAHPDPDRIYHIITYSEEETITTDHATIQVIPLWKFLLPDA